MHRLLCFSTLVFAGCAVDPPTAHESRLWQFAGDYYEGDGLGVNRTLTIASSGAYFYRWAGCLGTYFRGGGTAKLENGLLTLTSSGSKEGAEYYAVPWGERRYLIAKSEVREFCFDVNCGLEPRDDCHGQYYLREGDWKRFVSGVPSLPEEFQSLVLERPVVGRVVKVLEGARARVNLGRRDGIRCGMILHADLPFGKRPKPEDRDPSDWPARLRHIGLIPLEVESVDDSSCIVRYDADIELEEGREVRSQFK